LKAGLKDAWKTALPGVDGYTCCQDELLRNARSLLDQRIDLILHDGHVKVDDVDLLGERPSDRVGGLWPSDHAAVAATFELK
jgi:exonuclease III